MTRRLKICLLSLVLLISVGAGMYIILQRSLENPLGFQIVRVTETEGGSQRVEYELRNPTAFPVEVILNMALLPTIPGADPFREFFTMGNQGERVIIPGGGRYEGQLHGSKSHHFEGLDCTFYYSWDPIGQEKLRGLQPLLDRWADHLPESWQPTFKGAWWPRGGTVPQVVFPREVEKLASVEGKEAGS